MERYESVGETFEQRGLQPRLSPSNSETKHVQVDDSTNYFIASQGAKRGQRRRWAQDNGSWEKLLHAARTLSDLEYVFNTRRPYFAESNAVWYVNADTYATQLKQLEESLDKLLSSFHSVAFDPVDAVYSQSLSFASSCAAMESITNVLALAPSLKAVSRGADLLASVTRNGVSFLSDGADLPRMCLQMSESLDALEAQVAAVEAEVTTLRSGSQECNVILDAISAAYAATSRISPH